MEPDATPIDPNPMTPCKPRPHPLDELFTYHPASNEQKLAYEEIRSSAKDLVQVIQNHCPVGPDRSAAIRKVREAVMTANAAIATNNAAAAVR